LLGNHGIYAAKRNARKSLKGLLKGVAVVAVFR
jgi:hypothetical protein